MKKLVCAFAMASLSVFAPWQAHAQQSLTSISDSSENAAGVPEPVSPSPLPPAPCCKIPALTVVELEILEDLASDTSQAGQKVRIRAASPLAIDGQIVVPEGSEGFAEVVQASKARMMGKAGELVLGMPYLEVGGQRISLKRLRYGPSTGKGNDMAATVATAAIGLPGMLISGGNVRIARGARANAVVSADTVVTLEPQVSVQPRE